MKGTSLDRHESDLEEPDGQLQHIMAIVFVVPSPMYSPKFLLPFPTKLAGWMGVHIFGRHHLKIESIQIPTYVGLLKI
jgi:hypothetical protein